jgi:mannose/cellobiose epimerase-like protein (N-acyl-D-glucosamine 2-epimerase family)
MNRVMGVFDGLRQTNEQGEACGYAEDCLGSQPRRSNPHMHMLEAFLAWYEASGDEASLQRATEIVDLFRQKFYDSNSLLLGESFDQKLHHLNGCVTLFEPGHQFEWAHLLSKYAEMSKEQPLHEINGLFAMAKSLGTNPVTGLTYGEVDSSGKPLNLNSRCWMQTEMLSCLSTMAVGSMPYLAFEADRCAAQLWTNFINPAPSGMWIDVVDGRGHPATATVPASTFYHLINCIDAYTNINSENSHI